MHDHVLVLVIALFYPFTFGVNIAASCAFDPVLITHRFSPLRQCAQDPAAHASSSALPALTD